MKTPKFEGTVNLGHLLTFFGFIISGTLAFAAVRGDMGVLQERLARVEVSIVEITKLMVSDGRHEVMLGENRRRIETLERTVFK